MTLLQTKKSLLILASHRVTADGLKVWPLSFIEMPSNLALPVTLRFTVFCFRKKNSKYLKSRKLYLYFLSILTPNTITLAEIYSKRGVETWEGGF